MFFFTCQITEPQVVSNGPDKYPADYMFMQRAYPHGTINKEAIQEGKKIYKFAQELNNSKSLGEWSQEGPFNTGGRITDLLIHPNNPNQYYIGTSVGGIFRTMDAGGSWNPIFDDIGSPSIGDLAISKSNPSVVYAGTGEANASATSGSFFGTGVYKSVDGGDNWTHAGLENSNHIARIVVDQMDENILTVAATGELYGKNQDRGVYRSIDGGDTWDHLLFVTDSTACIDVVVHPSNNDIIYAAMWDRIRYPWIRDYGGPNSGIYRTLDGGQNWTKLSGGLPISNDETGRIGISISQTNPDVLYSVFTTNSITNVFEGVYKTTNGGNSWENVSDDLLDQNVFSSFGWFFGNIRVDPTDENKVYILGLNQFKTEDGGLTWNIKGNTRIEDDVFIQGIHVDQHALAFNESDSDQLLVGNDGGLYRTEDGMDNFEKITNLPITQFYEIEVDYLRPERLFGGTQDNNTIRTKTGNVDDFESILGGDGFHVLVNPQDPNTVYAEYQFGNLFKSTDGGDNFDRATDGIDNDDRTNWNTPIAMSPMNPNDLFYGSNKLYVSVGAEFWNPISDDLSNGLHPTGSQSFGTITTIACSHQDVDKIFVGTDDANVWVTDDFGANWTLINDGLPNLFVSKIIVDSQNDDKIYISFSGYRKQDYVPHILMSENGGIDWIDISSNLPEVPINDIELDTEHPGTIYIATDLGCWYSINDGISWNVLGKELPLTIVNDLKFHVPTRTMYAGTFGRSMFSLKIEDPLSAETIVKEYDFEIFPNPVAENLFIKNSEWMNENIPYHILAIDGSVIKSGILNQQKALNVSELGSGSYVLRIQDNDTIENHRFIKVNN